MFGPISGSRSLPILAAATERLDPMSLMTIADSPKEAAAFTAKQQKLWRGVIAKSVISSK